MSDPNRKAKPFPLRPNHYTSPSMHARCYSKTISRSRLIKKYNEGRPIDTRSQWEFKWPHHPYFDVELWKKYKVVARYSYHGIYREGGTPTHGTIGRISTRRKSRKAYNRAAEKQEFLEELNE